MCYVYYTIMSYTCMHAFINKYASDKDKVVGLFIPII